VKLGVWVTVGVCFDDRDCVTLGVADPVGVEVGLGVIDGVWVPD
jgi:hypothetical protein